MRWASATTSRPGGPARRRLVPAGSLRRIGRVRQGVRAPCLPKHVASQFHWRCVRGKLRAREGAIDEAKSLLSAATALIETSDQLDLQGYGLLDFAEVASWPESCRGRRPQRTSRRVLRTEGKRRLARRDASSPNAAAQRQRARSTIADRSRAGAAFAGLPVRAGPRSCRRELRRRARAPSRTESQRRRSGHRYAMGRGGVARVAGRWRAAPTRPRTQQPSDRESPAAAARPRCAGNRAPAGRRRRSARWPRRDRHRHRPGPGPGR